MLVRWSRSAAALAVILLGAGFLPLHAQAGLGRITGTVTDGRSGRPLSSATVAIRTTTMGGLTNDEGRYVIPNVLPGTYVLEVKRIGYSSASRSVTVAADGSVTADFSLAETVLTLEEVVITGTALATRAKEVGTSTEVVNSEEFANAPVQNPQDVIAGRVPSVTVFSNSGQPGAGGTIKIRGTTTISQATEPLIYVDGVRIFNEPTRNNWGARTASSPLQDIAASDIDRIEVVKGAAATTLYGTEASGGVIQIFTKRGLSGKPVWSLDVKQGALTDTHWGDRDDPTNLFVNCGNTSEMYGIDLSGSDAGRRVYFVDPTCPSSGKWTSTGHVQDYNLSVRGGGSKITYYVSGRYGDVNGVLPTQRSRDGGFRGNFTFQPIDMLNFTLNTSYTKRSTNWAGDGNNAEGFLLNVGRGWRGYMQGGRAGDCDAVADSIVCMTNAYVFDQTLTTGSDHFYTGFTTQFTPMANFSNRFSVGWDYTSFNNVTNLPFDFLTLPEGYLWDENTRHTKLSLDYAGTLQNTVMTDFTSALSWGGQLFRDRHRWTEFDVQGFPAPGTPTVETGAQLTYRADIPFSTTAAGLFLQEQVGWRDRIFLTGGMRVDGNSAFGSEFGLQVYPKINTSIVLSDFEFWPEQIAETFKLRAALGESGKAPGAFDKLRTWQAVSGNEGEPGVSPSNIGNPEVGPERTQEIELGFDASTLQGRLGIETTVFRATTKDALVPRIYPASAGFLESRIENIGTLRNEGLETQLRATLLSTRNFELRARTNLTWMRSEAVNLDGGDSSRSDVYTGLNSYIREGITVPSYVGVRIMNPDEFADPVLVSDTIIGPVNPTRLYGFGASATFGNRLTLDAQVDHQGGHYLQNYTAYQNARRGVWHPCYETQQKLIAYENGDASALDDVTALMRGRCSIDDYDIGFWTEKADFTKLRYVSLTYQLPQFLVAGHDASVTLAGRNLYTWTDYSGADPEVQDYVDQSNLVGAAGRFGRRDYYQIPSPRSWILSFHVQF